MRSLSKLMDDAVREQRSLASRPGEASTFTITLPVRSDALAPITPAEAPRIAVDTNNGATVLIVDDDPAARELLAANLKGAGYRLVHAASGDEALDLARNRLQRMHLIESHHSHDC